MEAKALKVQMNSIQHAKSTAIDRNLTQVANFSLNENPCYKINTA